MYIMLILLSEMEVMYTHIPILIFSKSNRTLRYNVLLICKVRVTLYRYLCTCTGKTEKDIYLKLFTFMLLEGI